MFTAALFMIAKIWVQPKGFQSTDEWVKKWMKNIFTYIHTLEHSSGKKINLAICDNTDGPLGYYA